jgi:hypothetical protein
MRVSLFEVMGDPVLKSVCVYTRIRAQVPTTREPSSLAAVPLYYAAACSIACGGMILCPGYQVISNYR